MPWWHDNGTLCRTLERCYDATVDVSDGLLCMLGVDVQVGGCWAGKSTYWGASREI